jgi:hypothetical protein
MGKITPFLAIPKEIQCHLGSKLYCPYDVENVEQIMIF